MVKTTLPLLAVCAALQACAQHQTVTPVVHRPPADIIKTAKPREWRTLDPNNTLVMTIKGMEVVLELAPRFAPLHAANIRTLFHEGYFNHSAVIRVHDNYVTQWGVPADESATGKETARSTGSAQSKLPMEFTIAANDLKLTPLRDADGWAAQSGFIDGFPVALDPAEDKAWLPHCYGMVGAGRDSAPDSSTGTSLYVVIGQSPRHLDRNITVVGRIIKGMEALSALPRGSGALGFYEKPSQYIPIPSASLLADLPANKRPQLEVMRTDSASFKELLESRRHATNPWFVRSPEYSNVCNISVPMRVVEHPKK